MTFHLNLFPFLFFFPTFIWTVLDWIRKMQFDFFFYFVFVFRQIIYRQNAIIYTLENSKTNATWYTRRKLRCNKMKMILLNFNVATHEFLNSIDVLYICGIMLRRVNQWIWRLFFLSLDILYFIFYYRKNKKFDLNENGICRMHLMIFHFHFPVKTLPP